MIRPRLNATSSGIVALLGLLAGGCSGGGGGDSAKTPTAPAPSAPVLTTVTVSLSAATIQVGQTAAASAAGLDQNGAAIATGAVAWSSSSPTVATISASGAITAVAAGQTTVTGTAGGKSGQATVTVLPVTSPSVIVSPGTATLVPGQTATFIAIVRDAVQNIVANPAVIWSSANLSVATVLQNGRVSAVSAGSVTITALANGQAGSAAVTGSTMITVSPTTTVTPPYAPYRALLEQVSSSGPLFVTARASIPGAALVTASYLLQTMLRNRPDVATTLRAAGALTGVFGRSVTSCDLPYFSDLAGTSSCTQGGLGGVRGRPATACAEANLLSYFDDPFGRGTQNGENVCVHELAHTIMNVGLTDADRTLIRARYDITMTEGKWTGDYAMQNADEFFAEMSQVYFCANPDIPAFLHTHGINCASRLLNYDAATYAVMDSIYRGAADLR